MRGMACAGKRSHSPPSSPAFLHSSILLTSGLQADHHCAALLHRLERHLRAVRHLAGLRWGRRVLKPSGGWLHETGAVPASTAAQAACPFKTQAHHEHLFPEALVGAPEHACGRGQEAGGTQVKESHCNRQACKPTLHGVAVALNSMRPQAACSPCSFLRRGWHCTIFHSRVHSMVARSYITLGGGAGGM